MTLKMRCGCGWAAIYGPLQSIYHLGDTKQTFSENIVGIQLCEVKEDKSHLGLYTHSVYVFVAPES